MRNVLTASLLATSMLSLPSVAHAQAMTAEEAAQLRAELAALKAQVQTLETRLDAATAQPTTAPAPISTPTTPSVTAKPATEISWKGAPEFKTADGWTFKPRGRMQLDVAGVKGLPDSIGDNGAGPAIQIGNRAGTATEFRRLYLGFDGTIPGGFAYRIEADFANSAVEITDAYLTYGTGPLSVTAGQIKPFWGLDDMTSDLFTSFTERAAFTQAFGFERRVGLSAQYKRKQLLLQAGVFSDNANDLLDDKNNSVSFDGRAVWMPKLAGAQLHLGGSFHLRDFNDLGPQDVRYRARPFVHTTDLRLVDTGAYPSGRLRSKGERGIGLEIAALAGPFHTAGELFWQKPKRVASFPPVVPFQTGEQVTFFGGYAEAGLVVTPGDRRGYKDGAFDRLKPSNPITEGGIGAIEINARYDMLDLNDGDVFGGEQKLALVSVVWAPVDFVRLTANYGRLWLNIPTFAGPTDYQGDVFGLRTQFDF